MHRRLIYLSALFLTLHYSLSLYVNSSFLEQFVSPALVGLIYALSSGLTMVLLAYMPRWIRRWGLVRTATVIGLVKLPLVLLLVIPDGVPLLLAAFVAYDSLALLISYALDLYLERWSKDQATGAIRGTYLTIINAVWLLGPLAAGFLLTADNFRLIYMVAGTALAPFLLLFARLPELKFHHRKSTDLRRLLVKLWQAKRGKLVDLRRILTIDFLLNLFYAIMVVYTPLYLHQTIGLDWQHIGIVLTLALLPFATLELPLGKIADRWLGEKEIMLIGLLICGLATFLVPFLQSRTWWVWAIVLGLTRVGASMIEIMKETYLFKKINYEDTAVLSLSRNLYPFAYLVGPLFGSLILLWAPIQNLFLFAGAFVLLGLYPALALKDTK